MRALHAVLLAGALVAAAPLTGAVTGPSVVSLADDGSAGTGPAQGGAISADGRFVAFTSADALTAQPVAGTQLYVRDRSTGRTVLASANAAGEPADAPVDDPTARRAYAISGDGRYVVFSTTATNLDPSGADGAARDVFRKDLVTGAVVTVSRAPDGAAANGSVAGDPDISYDGARVAYETGAATNLWTGDTSIASDVVVRDIAAGTTELVSVTGTGTPLTGMLRRASISADGSTVAFEDDGSVVVRGITAGTTTVVGPGANPDLSGDGGVVAYESGGGGVVVRPTVPGGTPTPVAAAGSLPTVSADGARVAFQTTDPLSVGDSNAVADVYIRDIGAAPVRVSERPGGPEVQSAATRPAMSANGGAVGFTLDDGNPSDSPDPADTNHAADVLVGELVPHDVAGPEIAQLDPAAPVTVSTPAVTISGLASDPSSVVSVTVAGARAVMSASGGFAVDVALAVGQNSVAVRAVDGAGNATERTVAITRSADAGAPPPVKARARILRVYRMGRATLVRLRVDAGAARVTARLWRSIPRRGRLPLWVPAGSLRQVRAAPGVRTAVLSRARLPAGLYQVRVTVASAGGVALAAGRYLAPRRPRTP